MDHEQPEGRSTKEVFADHLALAADHRFDEDIERNFFQSKRHIEELLRTSPVPHTVVAWRCAQVGEARPRHFERTNYQVDIGALRDSRRAPRNVAVREHGRDQRAEVCQRDLLQRPVRGQPRARLFVRTLPPYTGNRWLA